jgi:hypothetical protein
MVECRRPQAIFQREPIRGLFKDSTRLRRRFLGAEVLARMGSEGKSYANMYNILGSNSEISR